VKALFILNPAAGRKRDRQDVIELLEARAAMQPTLIRRCASKGELDGLIAEAAAADCQAVVAVGGDGTVNEIGRRLAGTPLAMGIIPTGSGNGLARHLRVPMSIPAAVRHLDACEPVDIDTASVNGVTFLGTFGVGFDALVAFRFAAAGSRGLRTYLQEGVRAFFGYKPETYRLRLDGEPFEETAFVLTVSNSNQYGNEARIAPLASLRDGLLDVCSLRQAPIVDAPFVVGRLFNGTLHRSSYLCIRKARSVSIERVGEGPAHIDGEPLMMGRQLEISIHPRSLRVLVRHDVAEQI
jgi:diacylglycerol kinase (ATP)